MLLISILRWPCLTVAFFVAGMLCLSTPGGAGLLRSRAGDQYSRLELEREIIAGTLEKMGISREETAEKLSRLSEEEIHQLASAMGKIRAGGDEEDQDSRALGVGLVIIVVLAAITGIYLFANN